MTLKTASALVTGRGALAWGERVEKAGWSGGVWGI